MNYTHASLLCADIVSQGTWSLLEELKDPATILHSRADSTVKKYLRAYRRWKNWATQCNFDSIPVKPHQFPTFG